MMRSKIPQIALIGLLTMLASCRHKLPLPPGEPEPVPQWPVWGGNFRHTANASDPVEFYVGPQLGNEVWARELSGEVGGAPSIHSDGTLYVGSGPANLYADSGFVYAIHPDGKVKWRFRTESPVAMSGALGEDGTYYVGDYGGHLYAIEASGELKWRVEAGAYHWGHPAITRNGMLVFPSYSRLSGFDSDTGELIWDLAADLRGQRGVSIANDGTIYVGTNTSLLALREDGSVVWEVPLTLGPFEVLIGGQGTLYFQIPGDSLFHALNPDGTRKWTFNIGALARGEGNNPALSVTEKIYVLKPGRPQQLLILDVEGREVHRLNLVDLSGAEGGVAVNYSTPIVDTGGVVYLTFLPSGGLPNWYAIGASGLLEWAVLIAPHDPLGMYPPAMGMDGSLYISSQLNVHKVQ